MCPPFPWFAVKAPAVGVKKKATEGWPFSECLLRLFVDTLLLDTRGFTLTLTEVEQFGATNAAYLVHFNAFDIGREQRETALYTYVVAHFANGERLRAAGTLAFDHHAFEGLDTLFVSFLDLIVYGHTVACFELGEFAFASELLVDEFYGFLHRGSIFRWAKVRTYFGKKNLFQEKTARFRGGFQNQCCIGYGKIPSSM